MSRTLSISLSNGTINAKWLRATGDDDNQHVVYLPELPLHVLRRSCECRPKIDDGVVVHEVLTSARARRGEVSH